ncbi:class I SAM-dependent methyltransferase [Bacillus sp. FJAT-49705]|uniref:Class I SAM-dependent methyltransferase n=2 Tax=Cytobacillus citreus TaxID=2833586 RepID=A0ABS5NSY7_9BACI|nr:class I SAM-dependent methyltransferase [Cytobacillus citreus]MBS4190940.1 class I SAM-dependent methyltransferase [Cytobacillus citreus]
MNFENSEEYDDPKLYDKENSFIDELPFLLKWADTSNEVMIELACGTGRVTIPIASRGYKLIGVDLHKGMLEEAKKKAYNQNVNITWVQQDCTKLSLKITCDLIFMVGNSFQHFLTNDAQDKLLSSVNRHLEMEGIFIFDTRYPSKEELLQPNTEEYWKTYIDNENGNAVDVYTISNYDSLNQIQYYTTIRRMKNNQGIVLGEQSTNISLRYVFPKEMERILSNNGFEIISIFQDWQENPITVDSYGMVYVCKKVR